MKATDRPIDISPADLKTVQQILADHVPELEVWAFGSRVSWHARATSDLDLALLTVESLDTIKLALLIEAFSNSDLPFSIDIVDWAETSEEFRDLIQRDYVVIQEAPIESETKNEWLATTVGDFAPFTYGKGLPASKRIQTGQIPVFGSNGIVGWHDEPLTKGPTVIVGRKGTVGAIHYSPTPCWPIDTTFFVTGDSAMLARFQYYILGSLGLGSMNTDSAVPGLNRDEAHARELRVPSISEQRAIAHVLGTLDDKIELNRRMNETLEAMAQALFKSWFVDFDPVRAKMDGRWKPGQSLPGLPAHLYDLFPNHLVPSELGDIPQGWRVTSLDEIANQRRYGVNPEQLDPETPYIALEHMPKRCIALSEWGTTAGLASSKFRFEQRDILFGKLRPYFHKVGIAPLNGVCSTDIVVISLASDEWFGLVLGHVSSLKFVGYTDATSTGTRMPRTKWNDMARYKIVLPDKVLAGAFTAIIQLCATRITWAIHESLTLATQRNALLPKLVSGELRVGETG